jgi:hypothetical protein
VAVSIGRLFQSFHSSMRQSEPHKCGRYRV